MKTKVLNLLISMVVCSAIFALLNLVVAYLNDAESLSEPFREGLVSGALFGLIYPFVQKLWEKWEKKSLK